MKQPSPPAIVPPGEGPHFAAFGDELTFHLTGEQTGGTVTMLTDVTPPGGGPPPHYHDNEDEWFFPLEGRVEFFHDGRWTEVPLGTVVFMPRGTVHAFRNLGDKPLKQLIQLTPAGFETFFARCAAEFNNPAGPDMQRILQIGTEHGIHFIPA